MKGARRWFAASAFILLAAASLVYLVGLQHAGRTCIEDGVERLVPEQLLRAEPEGYGAGIPREGVCQITHNGEVYKEVPLASWDYTEVAAVLGILAGLCVLGWLLATARARVRS